MKNPCAKTVTRENAYEVWSDGSWTWYVLKKWQVDDDKPFARWFCKEGEMMFDHGFSKACPSGNIMTEDKIWAKYKEDRHGNARSDNGDLSKDARENTREKINRKLDKNIRKAKNNKGSRTTTKEVSNCYNNNDKTV